MRQIKTHYLLLGLLTFSLWAGGETSLIPSSSPIAMARSSGARSRGGSFKRSSPPRSTTPSQRSTSPSRSSTTPAYSSPRTGQSDWGSSRSVPVPIPIPVPNRYPTGAYSNDYNQQRANQAPIIPNNDGISSAVLDDALINNGEQPPEAFTQQAITPAAQQSPPARSNIPPTTAQVMNQNTDSSGGGGLTWLLLPAAAVAGGVGLIVYNNHQRKNARGKMTPAAAGSAAEIDNDILTISEVQVALLANCPIQQQLTEIVQTMEVETPEQLKAQLQAVVLLLLRLPEYWSHAKVESQTFPDRTQAESYFEQWSMRERSKLSEETLTRDSFGLRQRSVTLDATEDPAAYVVVTLLLGTTHDRPLFDQVHSSESLKAILEQIATITTPELLTFELIWSPQDAADSLTRDELTMEYGDLVMV